MSVRTIHGTVEFIWDDDEDHMLVNLEPDDPAGPHTFELTGELRGKVVNVLSEGDRVEVDFEAEPYEVLDPDSGPSESLRAVVVDVRRVR